MIPPAACVARWRKIRPSRRNPATRLAPGRLPCEERGRYMTTFSLVPGSEGPWREFRITWGLRAGYGPAGRIYDLEEAIRGAHRWMRGRDARGAPFLSGMLTRGEVIYVGSPEATHDRSEEHTSELQSRVDISLA